MTEHVEQLVEALRGELQHYGEMLALLDVDEAARHRGLPAILIVLDSIRVQSAAINDARNHRLQAQSRLARVARIAGDPERESLLELVAGLSPDYQPLIRALLDEVDGLAVEVRHRAVLNQARLLAAADQLERFINSISITTAVPSTEVCSVPTARSASA